MCQIGKLTKQSKSDDCQDRIINPEPLSRAHLPAPTHAQNTQCFNLRTVFLDRFHQAEKLFSRLWRRCGPLEESAELLALLFRVRRVPAVICWLALKEVWNVDLILVVFIVGMRQDICTLEHLRAEAKDVEDNDDRGSSRRRPSCV